MINCSEYKTCINSTEPCAIACDVKLSQDYLNDHRRTGGDAAAQLAAKRKVLCIYRQDRMIEQRSRVQKRAAYDAALVEVEAELRSGLIVVDGGPHSRAWFQNSNVEKALERTPAVSRPINPDLRPRVLDIAAELLAADKPLHAFQQIYSPKLKRGRQSSAAAHFSLAVAVEKLVDGGMGVGEAAASFDNHKQSGWTAKAVQKVRKARPGEIIRSGVWPTDAKVDYALKEEPYASVDQDTPCGSFIRRSAAELNEVNRRDNADNALLNLAESKRNERRRTRGARMLRAVIAMEALELREARRRVLYCLNFHPKKEF